MNEAAVMATGLAVLSVASGMLGLGVAFAAVPFLGFFLYDLVHEVQPLSLFLRQSRWRQACSAWGRASC